LAAGVLDFSEPPERAARRLAPDVHLSPAQSYLMWAVTGSAGQFTSRPGELGPAELHAVVLNTIRRWHPDLLRLLPLAPSRVTLLGDAIHAMSPARGSGANTALRDAALLATELGAAARDEKTVVQAIADYERQMVDYRFA